jgi:hypothetical protein
MTIEEKLLEEINKDKMMYDLYHSLKGMWIDMDHIVARAVYYTADFEDAQTIIEYVDGGEDIEVAIYETCGYDWFQDHCSNTPYLDDDICNELI